LEFFYVYCKVVKNIVQIEISISNLKKGVN